MRGTGYRHYRFQQRGGNRFELLIDANRFFPAMLDAIDGARSSVLFEMYLFESGACARRFIDAFVGAAARGVSVTLLLDAFGAAGLQARDRKRLEAGRVALAFFNPLAQRKWLHNLLRDHRKLLLVDGRVAFVGGTGITDDFDPPAAPEKRWRETMVRIEGPVLQDWQKLFVEAWRQAGQNRALAASASLPVPDAGESSGRVAVSGGFSPQEIKRSLVKRTRGARQRVWISTAYFLPSWKIRRALRYAVRRGADVRLLLPGRFTDHPAVRHAGRRFYARLLRNGVKIFEYQPRCLHSKVVLCDAWVSIGSSNLDRWNFRWNREANQEIEDRRFAVAVAAMFEADFRQAKEYGYEAWIGRAWYKRWRDRIWGWVDLLLNRINIRGRPPVRRRPGRRG